MKVKIHFAKSNTIGGWAIRFFTWSEWNHVAIEIDDIVYDATLDGGVTSNTISHFKNRWGRTEVFEIDLPDVDQTRDFLLQQIGKSYDISAIFGFMFRRDWDSQDRWFCSELVFIALSKGGVNFSQWLLKKSNRITPRDLKLLMNFQNCPTK